MIGNRLDNMIVRKSSTDLHCELKKRRDEGGYDMLKHLLLTSLTSVNNKTTKSLLADAAKTVSLVDL